MLRLALIMTLIATNAHALTLHLNVTTPAETPATAKVYIAGDFQAWNPASPQHELTKTGDRRYEIDLVLPTGRIEFKFTRGSWDTVEKSPQGLEIGNRVLTPAQDESYDLTVARWADLGAPRTLTGDVTEHTIDGFLDDRRVWVYLPPGYHEQSRSYPVLLMLDGQNVFDLSTSFAGEWQVDESCEELIDAGEIEPLIVVAVDNGGAQRVSEYTPWPDPQHGGGQGQDHLQTLIDGLLPWIRTNYRTMDGPANWGFSGSSLGGLMSGFAALTASEYFGRIGAISPSIWWDNNHLVELAAATPAPAGAKLWIDMGSAESGDAIDQLRTLRQALVSKGWVLGETLRSEEFDGAAHNEPAWSVRFPDVLRYLFPARPGVDTQKSSVGHLKGSY